MGCATEKIIVKLKNKADIEPFCAFWREALGEGGYLSYYDEDLDLESEFRNQDDFNVMRIQDEPLFCEWEGGGQMQLLVLGFIKKNPETELEAEYTAEDDSDGSAVYDIYRYSNGSLFIRQAWSEYGLGDYCEECDTDFEDYLIKKDLEDDGYTCPVCGESLNYSARIKKYELKIINGKWEYPDGFEPFRALEEDYDPADDKYMTDLVVPALSNAWRYEDELDELGYLPDEPHGNDAWNKLPRVRKKAEEGDEKAKQILAEYESIGQ